MDLSGVVSLAIAGMGVSGLIFTALRYRRDDTQAIVATQDTLFGEMRSLNDELRQTAINLREENAKLAAQVAQLTAQVRELRRELD